MSTATLFQLYGLSYGNVTTDYVKAGGPNWDAYRWHDCLCSANLAAGFLGDPLRPSVGPRYTLCHLLSICYLCRHNFSDHTVCSALVSGTATGALPLPGWTNWDCSLRNCPKGHTSDRRHGETALKEVQRVLCSKSNSTNTSDFMVFSFLGAFTDRVYVNYGQSQIKAALEANPYIGNVSVYFPNYRADLVTSACWPGVDADNGGFTVQFDTEYGDLPLLDSLYDTDVVVKEDQPGRSVSPSVHDLLCDGIGMRHDSARTNMTDPVVVCSDQPGVRREYDGLLRSRQWRLRLQCEARILGRHRQPAGQRGGLQLLRPDPTVQGGQVHSLRDGESRLLKQGWLAFSCVVHEGTSMLGNTLVIRKTKARENHAG